MKSSWTNEFFWSVRMYQLCKDEDSDTYRTHRQYCSSFKEQKVCRKHGPFLSF